MNLRLVLLLSTFLSALFYQSCKEEETSLNDDYSIALNISRQEGNNIELEWESLNNSNFQEYIIVQSFDSIPDTSSPPVFDSNDPSLTFNFYQQEETSLEINPFTDLNDVYFKVFVRLDNRYILSPTVKVTSRDKPLSICANHAVIIPGTNHMIITESISDRTIIKYDFVAHEVLLEVEISKTDMRIHVGDAGNGLELFVFSPVSSSFPTNFNLLILDLNDFSTKEVINIGYPILDVVSSDKGFLFLTAKNWANSIMSLSRFDKTIIDNAQEQDYNDIRRIMIDPFNANRLLEISDHEITVHTFNDSGQFTALNSIDAITGNGVNKSIAISPSKNAFIATKKFSIYDSQNLSNLNDYIFSSPSYAFDSQNENFVYMIKESKNLHKFNRSTGTSELVFSAEQDIIQLFDIGNQLIFIQSDYSFIQEGFCNSYLTVIDK